LENANNYRKNDIWLTDAGYFKLRYLDVYYNLPINVVSKIKMRSLKVYLRGMNLFSIDRINVADPEAIGMVYPTLSSYHVGIRLGF
jgi:hypothetical protein